MDPSGNSEFPNKIPVDKIKFHLEISHILEVKSVGVSWWH